MSEQFAQSIDSLSHEMQVALLNELNRIARWYMQSEHAGQVAGVSPLALVYHLLGATQYFLVSKPTLQKLYSAQEYAAHEEAHIALLKKLLEQES